MAEYWTTEQVADFLKIEVRDVYQSRRNGDWPGIVGKQRGRRLLFRSDLIESGPSEPESTNDPQTAILWTVQGIEAKLAEILVELRKKGLHDLAEAQWNTFVSENLTDEGEEE